RNSHAFSKETRERQEGSREKEQEGERESEQEGFSLSHLQEQQTRYRHSTNGWRHGGNAPQRARHGRQNRLGARDGGRRRGRARRRSPIDDEGFAITAAAAKRSSWRRGRMGGVRVHGHSRGLQASDCCGRQPRNNTRVKKRLFPDRGGTGGVLVVSVVVTSGDCGIGPRIFPWSDLDEELSQATELLI
ncbi:hypothetical protein GWI33_023322, partial [Rhynchophorus ferrugineus]